MEGALRKQESRRNAGDQRGVCCGWSPGHLGAWGGLHLVGMMLSSSHLVPSPQGVITVKGLVDREKGDFYTLTVVADDGGPKVDSTVVSRTPWHSKTYIFTSHPTRGPGGGLGFRPPGHSAVAVMPHRPRQRRLVMRTQTGAAPHCWEGAGRAADC